jgi:hypothetical protein
MPGALRFATFFVDLSFADKGPVSLARAPANCKVNVQRPAQANSAPTQQPGESYFNALTSSSNFGAQFANAAIVICPWIAPHDFEAALKVLASAGALPPPNANGEYAKTVRIPGGRPSRLYDQLESSVR